MFINLGLATFTKCQVSQFLILIADQMDRRESINASVNQDVEAIFNSKTYSQLTQMHKQITQKIASGDAVDIGKHCFIHQ